MINSCLKKKTIKRDRTCIWMESLKEKNSHVTATQLHLNTQTVAEAWNMNGKEQLAQQATQWNGPQQQIDQIGI